MRRCNGRAGFACIERDTGDARWWLRLCCASARRPRSTRTGRAAQRAGHSAAAAMGRSPPAALVARRPADATQPAARSSVLPRSPATDPAPARGGRRAQRPRQGAELARRARRFAGRRGLSARDASASSRLALSRARLRRPAAPVEAQAHVLPGAAHCAATHDPRAALVAGRDLDAHRKTGLPVGDARTAGLVRPRRGRRPRTLRAATAQAEAQGSTFSKSSVGASPGRKYT